jgi:methylglutamate dehydrogenase subunit D
MDSPLVIRASALEGHFTPGHFGAEGDGVIFEEVRNLNLSQIAVWPETLDNLGQTIAEIYRVSTVPGPGKSATGPSGSILRIEPLKFWVVGVPASELAPDEGATLDLSHSRTCLRISGPEAATLLNRFLPLDLRDEAFPTGTVASTAFHHVGITLWRTDAGYEVFLPRGFALSLWELLREGAAQFGYAILPTAEEQ